MVIVAKFKSVGDWEALYVDGECVKQNHIGRIDVLDYLEGVTVGTTISTRVNLPDDVYQYPDTLEEVSENDDFDFELSEHK